MKHTSGIKTLLTLTIIAIILLGASDFVQGIIDDVDDGVTEMPSPSPMLSDPPEHAAPELTAERTPEPIKDYTPEPTDPYTPEPMKDSSLDIDPAVPEEFITFPQNGEIRILMSEAVTSDKGTVITFETLVLKAFSLDEFALLKNGASLKKYSQTFTVRPWTDEDRMNIRQEMPRILYGLELEDVVIIGPEWPYVYPCYIRDGMVIVCTPWDDNDFCDLFVTVGGATKTLTNETTVQILNYALASLYEDYFPDMYYAYEPSILVNKELFQFFPEFVVTISNGVWTNMRQEYWP
jgi:hypothetical protein